MTAKALWTTLVSCSILQTAWPALATPAPNDAPASKVSANSADKAAEKADKTAKAAKKKPKPDASPEPAEISTDGTDGTTDSPSEPSQQNSPFDQSNNPFNQQAFVPAISLILDASAGLHNLSNEDFGGLLSPLSLEAPGPEAEGINVGNGFNLNYAELSLAAPIDPYLDLFTVFHLHPSEFEIEEAYATTRGLPYNLTFKAGKFLSHFGRINPQHAHFWNFNDAPLVYSAFFGNEGLNELGARISWLAPTPFYLDLGLEVLQGNNSASFGKQGFTRGPNTLSENNLPDLVVATAKASFDLLDNLVLLGGLSYAQGGSRFFIEPPAGTADAAAAPTLGDGSLAAFAGTTSVAGADLSLRWFIDSYNELSWQTEFLFRHLGGQSYDDTGSSALEKNQSGLYSQLLWRFGQQWRTGVRLDLLTQNQTISAGTSSSGPSMLPRYAAMVEYLPSEFTRLRLQYELDQSRFANGANEAVHGLYLNLNLAMGAHGAHQF